MLSFHFTQFEKQTFRDLKSRYFKTENVFSLETVNHRHYDLGQENRK